MILLNETNDIVLLAAEIASDLHEGFEYSGVPYTYHLERTYNVLRRFGFKDPNLLAAALLHDTLEDTEADYGYLLDIFGYEITELVWKVTDVEILDRKERKLATYPKIASCDQAIVLKLADRVANVEVSVEEGSSFIQMYKKEHKDFSSFLYKGIKEHQRLWDYLKVLLFNI